MRTGRGSLIDAVTRGFQAALMVRRTFQVHPNPVRATACLLVFYDSVFEDITEADSNTDRVFPSERLFTTTRAPSS